VGFVRQAFHRVLRARRDHWRQGRRRTPSPRIRRQLRHCFSGETVLIRGCFHNLRRPRGSGSMVTTRLQRP